MKVNLPEIEIERAVEIFGGNRELAEFLGISLNAISNWRRKGYTHLPAKRAFQIVFFAPEEVRKQLDLEVLA